MIVTLAPENKAKEQLAKKKLRLISAFTDETTQYIDRECLKEIDSFPEMMQLRACYISAISVQTDTYYPGMRQYFSVELATALNANWVKMKVWMTIEELKTILNQSRKRKVERFVASFMETPAFYGNLAIRDWFGLYLHRTGIDIEVIKVKDHEMPRKRVNLYTTKGLIDFLRR